jgi:hypothetical protein
MVFGVSPTPLNTNLFFHRFFWNLTRCMTKLRVLVQQSNSQALHHHQNQIRIRTSKAYMCHVGFLKSAHSTYIHIYANAEKSLCHTLKIAQQ